MTIWMSIPLEKMWQCKCKIITRPFTVLCIAGVLSGFHDTLKGNRFSKILVPYFLRYKTLVNLKNILLNYCA